MILTQSICVIQMVFQFFGKINLTFLQINIGQRSMVKKIDKNLIVALDIGTSKIVAIVGEISPDNKIEIIGIGSHQSRGLRRGVVVNIDSTTQSIQRAIEEA